MGCACLVGDPNVDEATNDVTFNESSDEACGIFALASTKRSIESLHIFLKAVVSKPTSRDDRGNDEVNFLRQLNSESLRTLLSPLAS